MIFRTSVLAVLVLCLLSTILSACQATKRVIILVDGQRRAVETQAATVADVLREQRIQIGENDRVDPPDYTPIERTATIQIVRVEIKTETRREPIEFARKFTRDESLPDGKMRVVQLGSNGEAEITVQSTLEDGKEVSRREIKRETLKQPQDEVLALGTQNALAPVPIRGTIVYLAQGNAWVMRNSSNDKRPLTYEGDLDGRVFDLSPDGKYLLFTRAGKESLNTLWLADTVPLEEKPRRIMADNLLYGQWAGDGSARVAYSTGEKTPGAPGWKAHNDLYIVRLGGVTETLPITTTVVTPTQMTRTVPFTTIVTETRGVTRTSLFTRTVTSFRTVTDTVNITGTVVTTITASAKTPIWMQGRRLLEASAPAPYSWWGSNLAWAPDTNVFAFAFADQIGLINASTGARHAIREFSFYNTRADWVWTPQVSWSPDSRFVAAMLHAPPAGAGSPENSPVFDLWILARDNSVNLPLARDAGMWAFPFWSPRNANGESKIAYGVALNPEDVERSRYALYITDRDGSNRVRIWPPSAQGVGAQEQGLRVVQVAWSPDVSQLVAVREGDLWLYDLAHSTWSQITSNGDTRLPRWK